MIQIEDNINMGITFKEQLSLYLRNKRPKYPIILAEQHYKLHELSDKIHRNNLITYVDLNPNQSHLYFNWAYEAYVRSLKLVFLEAFYGIIGIDNIEFVHSLFTLGDALYIEAKGNFEIDADLVLKIKERMQNSVYADLVFTKEVVSRAMALHVCKELKMYSKKELLEFRRVSTVTLSCLKGFKSYMAGDLAYSTGELKVFDLIPFQKGILLLLPDRKDPLQVGKVIGLEKIYEAMHYAVDWASKIGIDTVADLNNAIVNKDIDNIILLQESAMERMLVEVAEEIYRHNKKIVLVAGPSSSGKTSFSMRLAIQLKTFGLHPHTISLDNYFINREDMIPEKDGSLNFETIKVVNVELFKQNMASILAGEEVEIPDFNFITGKQEYNGKTLKLEKDGVLIVEGIHGLNPILTDTLPDKAKFKIYVNPLTQIRLDEDTHVSVADIRLLRRMCRDDRSRGWTPAITIDTWGKVRDGELVNIFPYQENADVIFNTSLLYELLLLKPTVEPLLYSIKPNDLEYIEARRLLKFLDFFLSYNDKTVPVNSILKEFTGGSYFDV